MYLKYFDGEIEAYGFVLEIGKIIVTVFRTDKKYLKRFKILWRTRSHFRE